MWVAGNWHSPLLPLSVGWAAAANIIGRHVIPSTTSFFPPAPPPPPSFDSVPTEESRELFLFGDKL